MTGVPGLMAGNSSYCLAHIGEIIGQILPYRRLCECQLWLAVLLLFPVSAYSAENPIPLETTQMLLVSTGDWQSTTGTLQRYEREGGVWRPVGTEWPVALGAGGMGWGDGLHRDPVVGPRKREGDGRAPAGVYRLGPAYGYSPEPPDGTRINYRKTTTTDRCVDDPAATAYNQIVTVGPNNPERWKSAEQMRRTDELYRWVVVVAHNTEPVVPAQGSCIFLHVWGGPANPTAGCTAMAQDNLETVLTWLDPKASPVLVQLPRESYRTVRSTWGLP